MEKPDIDKPLIKGFLGWPETAVILGCTNLLFAVFLVVQIHYFFGGQVNISETGFTYSEYARRGFGELLAVAILSLLLYLGLSIVAKLEKKSYRTGFTALTFLLIAQVIVILVSAFQRLRLYEEAYGFTQLRIYSHVFMLWLGILLITALALEMLSKRGWFALAVLISSFGFVASLAIINVDGQVVRQNITRSFGEEKQISALDSRTFVDELDSEYFKELSDDAVPVMADFYENSSSAEIKGLMGMHLACRQKLLEETTTSWQSFNLSESNARRILSALSESLSVYQLSKVDDQWVVTNGTQEMSCSPELSYMID